MSVLVAALLLPALLALDSLVTALTSPERRIRVVAVAEAGPAPTGDPAAATLLLNGLGRDISVEQARALAPSLSRYGRVLALEQGAVFDPDASADAVQGVFAGSGVPPPWYLVVAASSMGDVRGLELIASLEQRHPDVRVEGFVVNTGPGPHKRARVKAPGGQFVIDSGCTPFVPGAVTLAALEVVNQSLQGNVGDLRDAATAWDMGRGYRGSVVMDQLCSLTRPVTLDDPPAVGWSVYLMTGRPDDDLVVDDEGAYADWREVLPDMGVRRVRGATHDNFSFRPDLFNPLFADDLMPAIRAGRRLREQPLHHGPTQRPA